MDVSRKSLHYRWIEWVYGWYSENPVPNNLCSYFWRLLFSPIPLFGFLLFYIFSLCISLVLAVVWWIAGHRPNFKFVEVQNPNYFDGPINVFTCGNYKTGLYGKDVTTKSLVAPWEVLLVLGVVILVFTTFKMSMIGLTIGVCLWLLILGVMRGGKLVGPFFRSIKEKHCKKINFVD